jgi:hypothetical protein
MYKVISWDTNEILSEHPNLNKTKRICRAYGAEELSKPWENKYHKWLTPLAYVQDEHGFCVYNPRFKNPAYTGE